ncbi:hypothetical protein K5549_020294, partial [Capra hircus]
GATGAPRAGLRRSLAGRSLTAVFLSADGEVVEVGLQQLLGEPPPWQVAVVHDPAVGPAYEFGEDGSGGGQAARSLLPSTFFQDFSLLVRVRPASARAGVLFAVTDPAQAVVSVGVKLTAARGGRQHLQLLYTEPGATDTRSAASFQLPALDGRWTRLALSVDGAYARLFVDCKEVQGQPLAHSLHDLQLEPDARLFVAQAGGADPEKFQGLISELRLRRDPRVSPRQCQDEDEDDDDDGVSGHCLARAGAPLLLPPLCSGTRLGPRLPEAPPVTSPPLAGVGTEEDLRTEEVEESTTVPLFIPRVRGVCACYICHRAT